MFKIFKKKKAPDKEEEKKDKDVEILKEPESTGYGGEFYDSVAENFCFDEEVIDAYSTSTMNSDDINLREIYYFLCDLLDTESAAMNEVNSAYSITTILHFNKFKIIKFSNYYSICFNEILIMERSYNCVGDVKDTVSHKKFLPYLYFLQEFLSDICEKKKAEENEKAYKQLMKGVNELLC